MEILKLLRLQWDRTVALTALLVGALALILGYVGVSGTPHVAEQLPYFISGGLFGIFMLGIASVAWLTADLRDEWRELRALRNLLEEDMARQARTDSGTSTSLPLS
jgi:hypothetical protein